MRERENGTDQLYLCDVVACACERVCESMCQRRRVSDDACKYLCVGDIFSFVMEDFLRLRSHDDRLMSKASGCFFEAFTLGWLKTNWMDIIIVLLIMNFCLSDALNEKTTFGQKRIVLPALFISLPRSWC